MRHPGPPQAQRIDSIAGESLSLQFDLAAGLSLRDALVRPLLAADLPGAAVRMQGVILDDLHFVRPSLPPDDQHVAYYSEPHFAKGKASIHLACATIGRKDGEPFVHCHALWRDSAGMECGGHLFTDRVQVVRTARVQAWGILNAVMEAEFDEETNFTLFRPKAVPGRAPRLQGRRTVVARIRPNEDLTIAIEDVCALHGIGSALVRGSVGSTVGVLFEDGRLVEDIATEILVLEGRVEPSASGPRARLDIAVIDPRGGVHRGRLARGQNPVLICFELVLEEIC